MLCGELGVDVLKPPVVVRHYDTLADLLGDSRVHPEPTEIGYGRRGYGSELGLERRRHDWPVGQLLTDDP
jgi:hypothetical protein